MEPDVAEENNSGSGAETPRTRLHDGREVDARELAGLVYADLRRIAGSLFKRQPVGATLQPTALVHEAYVRLADRSASDWRDRAHFLAVAARTMRGVLVDAARARGSLKRGGAGERVTLAEGLAIAADGQILLLDLEAALVRLGKVKERYVELVELRLFGGLEFDEIAAVLELSRRQVFKDWGLARSYLEVFLEDGETPADG